MLGGLLFAAACSDAMGGTPGEDGDAGAADVLARDAGTLEASVDGGHEHDAVSTPPVLLFNLRAAPFPNSGHPDVAVHVPPGFDSYTRPGLIVFFHGFDNCVVNVVGSVDTECTPGGPVRGALHLIDQLNAARVNAILVAVELRFDMATGDPGQLTKAGDFGALLRELFTEHMATVLGRTLDVPDFDRIVVGTHSGGYQATAMALEHGQVPQIREVDLYDSLYGETAIFDGWMQTNAARFDTSRPDGLRWADVYTSGGGTAADSRTMASSAGAWLRGAGLGGSMYDDDTTATMAPADYGHPVLFKLSGLAHGEVPKYYFQRLTQAAGFAAIP